MDDNLDDGHQTDRGRLCDTRLSPVQSAQIFCRRHRNMNRESNKKPSVSDLMKQMKSLLTW